jgi:hypothetical protein
MSHFSLKYHYFYNAINQKDKFVLNKIVGLK